MHSKQGAVLAQNWLLPQSIFTILVAATTYVLSEVSNS